MILKHNNIRNGKDAETMKGKTMLLLVFLLAASTASVKADQIKDADVCRFGMATIFSRSPEIMKAKHLGGGIYEIFYVRKSDGTHWHNKCRVEGNLIIWGALDGRWRIHPSDSKVTFEVSGDNIIVKETYADGSSTIETYLM